MSDLNGIEEHGSLGGVLPALIIAQYSEPGSLVVDLGCGVGSALVEAIRADRLAIGIERNSRLAREAREVVVRTTAQGGPGFAAVVVGELADVPELVGADALGKVSLVLIDLARAGVLGTHGRVDAPGVLDRFSEALHAARRLLRPDGHVVITARERDRFCWSLADLLSELGAELDLRVVEPAGSAERGALCRVRCAVAGSSEVVVLQLARSAESVEPTTRHEFAAVGA